ncbi:MAG: ROK family protein, partial [Chloroflexi bacterium]|nr:ROK family protein [Chloroflexota bacterium]
MSGAAGASGRPLELVLPAVPQGPSEFNSVQPVLALDLGGTLTRAAVVSRDGRLSGRLAVPTPLEAGAEAVVQTAITTLHATLREAGSDAAVGDQGRPWAVAVSAPGPLDPWTGVVIDPPNMGPGFRGMPLGQRIEEALGLPCVVERDTNVAALGEVVFGAAIGCRDFIYITVSTGIGGAVVTAGRLMMGPDGVAGELGHIVVDMAGE